MKKILLFALCIVGYVLGAEVDEERQALMRRVVFTEKARRIYDDVNNAALSNLRPGNMMHHELANPCSLFFLGVFASTISKQALIGVGAGAATAVQTLVGCGINEWRQRSARVNAARETRNIPVNSALLSAAYRSNFNSDFLRTLVSTAVVPGIEAIGLGVASLFQEDAETRADLQAAAYGAGIAGATKTALAVWDRIYMGQRLAESLSLRTVESDEFPTQD